MNLSIGKFEQAYKVIAEHLRKTPLVYNEWLSKKYGANIYLKLENLQPVGSFKVRGALYKISKLSPKEKSQGVIAVSAGNHAQGVAWAASKFDIPATIIMPKNAPINKIVSTEKLGATVILEGNNVDESFAFLEEYNKKHNHVYVHPFADEDVILGQGSIALELCEQIKNIDYLFGSIGGGGLVTGVGSVLKNKYPNTQIIASQPKGACSMIQSLYQAKVTYSKTVSTFADGIKVKVPSEMMMKLLEELIDDSVIVNDDQIAQGVLDLMEQARVIAEGAGAINLAAFDLLHKRSPEKFKDKDIVILICGGNIDINLIDRIIDIGLIQSSRKRKVKIVLEDIPGALNLLTEKILNAGANVLEVEHRRDDPRIKFGQSLVQITLETKDEKHTHEILSELESNFEVVP